MRSDIKLQRPESYSTPFPSVSPETPAAPSLRWAGRRVCVLLGRTRRLTCEHMSAREDIQGRNTQPRREGFTEEAWQRAGCREAREKLAARGSCPLSAWGASR